MLNTHKNNKPLALITRPLEDARGLSQEMQNLDFEILIEPMLTINVDYTQTKPLEDLIKKSPQAIIITSANGIIALADLSPERDIAIITIGHASYEKAQSMGYNNVDMANPEYGGDVNGIVKYISENYHNNDKMMLYVSGKIVSGNLVNDLKKQGKNIQQISLYDAEATTFLSLEAQEKLKKNSVNLISFYSPRTAQIFIKLVEKAGLIDNLSNINCYCLSQNIAHEMEEIAFKNIYIAKNPTSDSMLSLIKENK